MSSHHIVREKQEPALLILGLNNFSEELLGQLLEWSPTVITTPIIAEEINSFEIKIDIIVANEFDSVLQSNVKTIPQGEASQFEAVLNYLIQNDYKAVNIVTDNADLTDLTPFAEHINIVVYCGSEKIYAINTGFSKWKPAGETLRILSVHLNLQTSGLIAQPNNAFITANDGFFTLSFDNDFLFIAEEL